MSAGILRNWYLSKVSHAKTPIEYLVAMQGLMLYEISVFNFNTRDYFGVLIDK